MAATAACLGREESRELVAKHQAGRRATAGPWTRLADALDRLLGGEQDSNILTEGLDPDQSKLIQAILEAVADPSQLQALLEGQEKSEE